MKVWASVLFNNPACANERPCLLRMPVSHSDAGSIASLSGSEAPSTTFHATCCSPPSRYSSKVTLHCTARVHTQDTKPAHISSRFTSRSLSLSFCGTLSRSLTPSLPTSLLAHPLSPTSRLPRHALPSLSAHSLHTCSYLPLRSASIINNMSAPDSCTCSPTH